MKPRQISSERVPEAMKQLLLQRPLTISRATGSLTFPANFMLIAAPPRDAGLEQ